MPKHSVNFGVELEFEGPNMEFLEGYFERFSKTDIGWNDPYMEHDGSDWTYCEDESFCGCMEIQTPKFQRLVDLRPLKSILLGLSRFCWITKDCGMHIHVSSPNDYNIAGEELAKDVWKNYGKKIWKSRKCFTRKGFEQTGCGNHENRIVEGFYDDNRVEIRAFNGTLDYDTVVERVKESLEMYRSCLYPSDIPIEKAALYVKNKKKRKVA